MYWEKIIRKFFPKAEDLWENWETKNIGFKIVSCGMEMQLALDMVGLQKELNTSQIEIKTIVSVSNDSYSSKSVSVDFLIPRCVQCNGEPIWGMRCNIITKILISGVEFPNRPK